MSGVGISGLIANLPGTVTPYPTQDPLLELGGYRSVTNAAARDAIPANFRVVGMEVTLQDTGATYELFGGTANSNWKLKSAPFVASFYVDPTATGPQLGSSSNPFTTVAAAFAFAATLSITAGIIYLPPNQTVTENVVFPVGAGNWEIASSNQFGYFNAILTGTVDVSCSASARRALTNIQMNGSISGNCSGGTGRLMLTNTAVIGALTLTGTGASNVWRVALRGSPPDVVTGSTGIGGASINGACAIFGALFAFCAILGTSLAFTLNSQLSFTGLPPAIIANDNATLWLNGVSNTLGGLITISAASGKSLTVQPDGASLTEMLRFSWAAGGAGTVTCFGENGGRSSRSAQSTNVGSSPITARTPASLMVCEACLTLLANGGTATGLATLNVIYTDVTGTLVTEAVTTALNVAGAVGSKARGTLPFSQNGATGVAYSVTGITLATALSYQLDVAVRQAS